MSVRSVERKILFSSFHTPHFPYRYVHTFLNGIAVSGGSYFVNLYMYLVGIHSVLSSSTSASLNPPIITLPCTNLTQTIPSTPNAYKRSCWRWWPSPDFSFSPLRFISLAVTVIIQHFFLLHNTNQYLDRQTSIYLSI